MTTQLAKSVLIRVYFECHKCQETWWQVVIIDDVKPRDCMSCGGKGTAVPEDMDADDAVDASTSCRVNIGPNVDDGSGGLGCLLMIVLGVLLWGFITVVQWVVK